MDLPKDTEIFPKQHKLSEKDTGNGIMLPFMDRIGNDYIKDLNTTNASEENPFIMGTLEEFCEAVERLRINADWIKIDLPEEPKPNGKLEELNSTYSKWDILRKIKDGSIEQHPTIGGKYYSWIQIIICKCIKQGYGDNEILKLIKEVHQEDINTEYVWPESYYKQIEYTRGERQLNIPNPGDTNKLEDKSLDSALKLEEIANAYCYVMANDMFNRLGTPEFYQEKQINNYHKHEVFINRGTLTNKLLSKPGFAKAETFITSARHKPGLLNIDKPGIVPLINRGTVLNIYIPNHIEPTKGDILFLTEFFTWLVGEKKWRIIEEWIAYMVQYPGIKIKWAVVLVSEVEGVGKGLLARICSRVLGEDNVNENANYKHLTNSHNTLLIGTQLLVLNEVSLGDFKSKNEGTNTLKNFVADDIYSCNFKNKPMVKLPNLTNFMLFSNDPGVLGVSQGVRRYFFCNIPKTEEEIIQKTNENFFQKAWDFVDSDEGASALLHYFKYEVKIKDPSVFQKRAPETDDLKELIERSKHPVVKKLEYDLTKDNPIIFTDFWPGIITFDWLNDKLNTYDKDDHKQFDWGSYGDDALYKFLSANCKPWNNGEKTRQIEINGVRQRFYLIDDTRCPIPGKSYKDLTPKQIETIYKDYSGVYREIRDEEDKYNEAKKTIVEKINSMKIILKDYIKEGEKGKFNKEFKGLTVDKAYELVMKRELEVVNKTPSDLFTQIIRLQSLIDKGIRAPEKIVEEIKFKKWNY